MTKILIIISIYTSKKFIISILLEDVMISAILLLLFSIFSVNIFSQEIDSEKELEKKLILNEYQYKFFKGDTLTYRVSSRDSIVIEFGKPLTKDRLEIIEITCDSVTKTNKFYLSLRLVSYIADETFSDSEKIRRTTSPWLNRVSKIIIDSAGNRFSSTVNDSSIFAMSPGGAFQPYLILTIKDNYKLDHQSWIVSTIDTLAENGTPYPILKQSSLLRADSPTDTLTYSCNVFNYIRTATGKVLTITNDTNVLVESILNLGGTYYLSNKYWIPVTMTSTSEQRLTITTPEKDAMPGLHFISTVWELDRFIQSPQRIKFYENIENRKLKKNNKQK